VSCQDLIRHWIMGFEALSVTVSNFPYNFRRVCQSSAYQDRLASDAVGRFNWQYFDAARVDSQAVMKRCQVEIAMDRAQIGKVGTAARQWIHASARRRLAR
jgi:hypothetical protein